MVSPSEILYLPFQTPSSFPAQQFTNSPGFVHLLFRLGLTHVGSEHRGLPTKRFSVKLSHAVSVIRRHFRNGLLDSFAFLLNSSASLCNAWTSNGLAFTCGPRSGPSGATPC